MNTQQIMKFWAVCTHHQTKMGTTLTIYAQSAAAACQMVEDLGHSVIYIEPAREAQPEGPNDDYSLGSGSH